MDRTHLCGDLFMDGLVLTIIGEAAIPKDTLLGGEVDFRIIHHILEHAAEDFLSFALAHVTVQFIDNQKSFLC